MEGHCSTGQSPQWAVVPMEEEEKEICEMLQLTPDNEGDVFPPNVHNHSLPHTTTCTVPDVLKS